jgi:cytochrome c-type biogenesis protein CcsB
VTPIVLNEGLSQLSLVVVYAAMAVFTLAFLVSGYHLSQAASSKTAKAKAQPVMAQSGSVSVLERDENQKDSAPTPSRSLLALERISLALSILGTLILAVAVTMRGIAAARVPWANLYEYSITGALILMTIYLVSVRSKEVRIMATFVVGFVLLVLGTAVSVFYVQVASLMPALQSYWLVIHVMVALLATGFFSMAAALSAAYLLKTANWVENANTPRTIAFKKIMEVFPSKDTLERLAYRFNISGFILWSFTLIAGAIWAERAWHRYWGWDTKEVWTFIIWALYAGYLHANATRGWTGKRAVWLGLVGFAAVVFNFTIVNMFFKGLHVYSGL